MNKLILMMGSRHSGKGDIVSNILGGIKNSRKIHVIDFDDMVQREMGKSGSRNWKNVSVVEKIRDNVYLKLEKEIIENYQKGKDVVIDGFFLIETENGFFPMISGNFFDAFKPAALILYEIHINKKIPRKKDDIEKLLTLEREQDLNKHYAGVYSTLAGSMIKIIRIKDQGVRKALKETKNVLDFVLGA